MNKSEITQKRRTLKRTFISYCAGFVLSLLLTLAAYVSVVNQTQPAGQLFVLVVGLAIVQLLVQLVFFLHLGHETRPRWRLIMFAFALLTVGILVFGSLWIMSHLDYNMMSPHDTNTNIMHDEGINRY